MKKLLRVVKSVVFGYALIFAGYCSLDYNNMMNAKEKEKTGAATSSVYAAIGLTLMKIIVGIYSGSLGILAEAAHSGLDLVAAVLTLFAVKIAEKPPDTNHLYGHGKVENISALFETLLLALTCAWILYEAGHRLLSGEIDIEVGFFSFAVIIISIIVDYSRSRMLFRVAKKHNSQALEADALHFSTDIWSSSVVLGGLSAVLLSDYYNGLYLLKRADAFAAIIVAFIVLGVSYKMGMKTVQALLDAAPKGLKEKIIREVELIGGVRNCHRTRVRYSGGNCFVDMHVNLCGKMSLEEAHEITEKIENHIKTILPEADITVHPEPEESSDAPD